MIFRVHIPKDAARFAQKIRTLLTNHKITTDTYKPDNATIGIKVHENINQKLLGKVVGLIQRSGYELYRAAPANAKAALSVSSPQREQKTIEINKRKR